MHFKTFIIERERERERDKRALIRADYSGGCWEVSEVGGGRGRETERREEIHVMMKRC